MTAWARVHASLRQDAEALEWSTRAVNVAATSSTSVPEVQDALRVRALALSHVGRIEESEQILERSIRSSHSMPYPLAEARALSDLGEILMRKGDFGQGRTRLQDALGIFHRLGAKVYIGQVEQSLAHLSDET
ncbi:MAG: hypothetical protein ACR2JC_13350 [Chloroflexota bacterium]